MRNLVLALVGDREQVLRDFKALCATKGISMTSRLVDIIKKDLDENLTNK